MTAGSSTATVTRSASWAASTAPRAVPRGGRAGRELREDGLIPDHRLPALLGEARDDGGRPGPPMRLEQALEGGEAYVRQVHRPRHDPGGTNRLEGGEGGAQRSDRVAREIGVLDDDALVGGEGGSDARRVGSEHHDAGDRKSTR